MNRIIMFRAWTGEKMRQCAVSESGMTVMGLGESSAPLMQNIGVQDKNGKWIYEGDVVLVYPFRESQSFLAEVAWSESYLAFRFYPATKEADERERTHDDIYEYTEDNEYEVIGNIYETHRSLIAKV